METNSIYLDNINDETESVFSYQHKYELDNEEKLRKFVTDFYLWESAHSFQSTPNFEINSESLELEGFKNLFIEHDQDKLKGKSIVISGRIYKTKLNNYYKYNSENTIISINLKNFLNNINWLSSKKLKSKKINIILLEGDRKELSTPFLNFGLIGDEIIDVELTKDTKKEIKFLENIGFHFNDSANLIKFDNPTLAKFDNETLKIYTKNIIDRLLSLISEDCENYYRLSGMKIVKIYKNWDDLDKTNISDADISKIYSMWQFLFDENRFNDKKIFLNKSITLYLSTKSNYVGFVKDFNNISDQVEKLFESYVEHSVEVFVTQESKMIEIYTEASKTINDSIKDVTQKVRDIFLAFMGVFLITFLEKNNSILNSSIINLALIMYFIYGFINLISICSIYKQNKIELVNFEHMVDKINKQISIDVDDQYKTEYVVKSEHQFKKVFWLSFVFIAIISVVMLGLFVLHRNPDWKFSKCIINVIKYIIGYSV